MKKLLLGFVFLGSVMTAATAKADCTVTFGDYFALNNVHIGWARAGFAAWTQWDSARNRPMQCQNMSANAWQTGCWSYRQRCGSMQNGQPAYFNAWPNVNEMHLMFRNNSVIGSSPPGVPGCFCNPNDGMGPGFGFRVGGTCYSDPSTCPEWRNYERNLTPHAAGFNYMMFVEQGGDSIQHVYDIDQFEVFTGDPGNLCWTDTSNVSRCYYGLTGWNNWQVNIRDAKKAWFYSDTGVPSASRATIRTKY
jgi:hypothetical protein